MLIGEVDGKIWADQINLASSAQGRRLVLVDPGGGSTRVVAVDPLNVGVGNTVLVATDEAAAAVVGEPAVDAAVVALVADTGPAGG